MLFGSGVREGAEVAVVGLAVAVVGFSGFPV